MQPLTSKRPKLTVVVPVFNERATAKEALDALLAKEIDGMDIEIILVESNSTDGTREIVLGYKEHPRVRIILEERARGKGHAVRAGFAAATGDILLIQDADLEYDPRDILPLIQPIVDGDADVVFGSRFTGGPHRVLYFWHMVMNRGLTLVSNMLNDLNLTDMETCYKAFRAEVIKSVAIEEDRFGIEPELTAKVAKMNLRIYEIPVSYRGRTYADGKKIGWKDGVRAMYCIVKYGVRRRSS